MLMPLSFWASGGDGGVGITIEMAFSSCGNPNNTVRITDQIASL